MSSRSPVRPDALERLLAGRADDEETVALTDLSPSAVLTFATTTDGDPSETVDGFDWASVSTLVRALPTNQREEWLRSAIARIGIAGSGGIDSREGIEAVGELTRELRHSQPELYLAYVAELHRLSRSDVEGNVETADTLFDTFGDADGRPSDSKLDAFYRGDVCRRLLDETLTGESRRSALKQLSTESFEDVTSEHLIDVFAPLQYHKRDPTVVRGVFETFGNWARAFPSNATPDDVRLALEQQLVDENSERPPRLDEELVVTHHVVPAIIAWFLDSETLSRDESVVLEVFEALQHISGVREFTDELCELIETGDFSPETVNAGIDLLGSLLVGVSPYHYTKNHSQPDIVRRILFTDKELGTDETVRETLRGVFEDESRPSDIRARAVRVLLSVRPPETYEIVRSVSLDGTGDPKITDAILDAVETHRLIGFVDLVTERIDEDAVDFSEVDRLVDVLGTLGIREVVPILLDPHGNTENREDFTDQLVARGGPSGRSLYKRAEAVLAKAGYGAEIKRKRVFKLFQSNIDERFDAMSAVTDADRANRDTRRERIDALSDHALTSVQASLTVGVSIDSAIRAQTRCAELSLRLAPLHDRFNSLADRIDTFRAREATVRGRLTQVVTEVQRNADEITRVERMYDEKTRDIDRKVAEQSKARKKLDRQESQQSELLSTVKSRQSELRQAKAAEPSYPSGGNEDTLDRYRSDHSSWERRVNEARNRLESTERDLKSAESKIDKTRRQLDKLGKAINRLREERQKIESKQRTLSRQLDDLIAQRERHRSDLNEIQNQLTALQRKHARTERQIEEITTEIEQRQQQIDARISDVPDEMEQFRRDLSERENRLMELHEQTHATGMRRREANERVVEATEKIDQSHWNLGESGSQVLTESDTADQAAVDASDTAARQQYDQNVEQWRLSSAIRQSDGVAAESEPELVERAEAVLEGIR